MERRDFIEIIESQKDTINHLKEMVSELKAMIKSLEAKVGIHPLFPFVD